MPAATRGRPRGEKPWSDAIRKAAYRAAGEGDLRLIDKIAETTVRMALEGDIGAIREIGERLDGKAPAALEISGEVTRYVIEVPARPTDALAWERQHAPKAPPMITVLAPEDDTTH